MLELSRYADNSLIEYVPCKPAGLPQHFSVLLRVTACFVIEMMALDDNTRALSLHRAEGKRFHLAGQPDASYFRPRAGFAPT